MISLLKVYFTNIATIINIGSIKIIVNSPECHKQCHQRNKFAQNMDIKLREKPTVHLWPLDSLLEILNLL